MLCASLVLPPCPPHLQVLLGTAATAVAAQVLTTATLLPPSISIQSSPADTPLAYTGLTPGGAQRVPPTFSPPLQEALLLLEDPEDASPSLQRSTVGRKGHSDEGTPGTVPADTSPYSSDSGPSAASDQGGPEGRLAPTGATSVWDVSSNRVAALRHAATEAGLLAGTAAILGVALGDARPRSTGMFSYALTGHWAASTAALCCVLFPVVDPLVAQAWAALLTTVGGASGSTGGSALVQQVSRHGPVSERVLGGGAGLCTRSGRMILITLASAPHGAGQGVAQVALNDRGLALRHGVWILLPNISHTMLRCCPAPLAQLSPCR